MFISMERKTKTETEKKLVYHSTPSTPLLSVHYHNEIKNWHNLISTRPKQIA